MKEKIHNIILSFIIILLTILVFINQDVTTNYFIDSFYFLIKIIIPSLFPFMIFINFILNSNSIDYLSIVLKPIGKLLNLSGYGIACIIGSILGGYPYSSLMVSTFIKEHKISTDEGKRIIKYCQFPSLAFLFVGLLNFDKDFIYIIISLYASSFLMLLISSFKNNNEYIHSTKININNNLTKIYFEVLHSSIKSLLSISFTIIFFSLLTSLLSLVINNERTIYYISGFFEFSNSSINILLFDNKNFIDYIMLMIIISFSSFSIIIQSMYYLKEVHIKIKQLLFSRITIALISIIIFSVIFYIRS